MRNRCLLVMLALVAACSSPPVGAAAEPPSVASGTHVPERERLSDWPMFHRDPGRSGLAPGTPPVGPLSTAWSAALDGAVYGQPLVVGSRVLAATENNTVYALDPADGKQLWSHNLGAPATAAQLPCGNIDPLGITGTAAYDPASGLVFVLAELSGGKHALAGLDVVTGKEVVRQEVEPPRGQASAHQQRAALAIWQGRVYIAFGGLSGDCSDYVGSVVSVAVTGGPAISYSVPTARQGGIWSPGGPVADGDRLLVAVGNGAATGDPYDGSDSVVALTPDLRRTDFFAPDTWADDNANDVDLGSGTPVRVGSYLLIAGKRGTAYTLAPNHLGGIGGQAAKTEACSGFGAPAVAGDTAYLPCDDGLTLMKVAADGTPSTGWRMPLHGAGSPAIGGGAVWVTDYQQAQLFALDPADGHVLQQITVPSLPHFASPTLSGGRVLLGTLTGVTAVGGA